jgi:hypothetical protein
MMEMRMPISIPVVYGKMTEMRMPISTPIVYGKTTEMQMLISTPVVYRKMIMIHLIGFEAMDLLYPLKSINMRTIAAIRGVNTWSYLLLDEADLMLYRGLDDTIKSGSHDNELLIKG